MTENKKKVLIIEDEIATLDMLESLLGAEGYEILTATDGKNGLDLAKKERPDLILLDIMLFKLDGFKLCRMLKFDENFRNIPIIMVTCLVTPADQQKGKEVGADEYICKPFKVSDLLAKIKKILG